MELDNNLKEPLLDPIKNSFQSHTKPTAVKKESLFKQKAKNHQEEESSNQSFTHQR